MTKICLIRMDRQDRITEIRNCHVQGEVVTNFEFPIVLNYKFLEKTFSSSVLYCATQVPGIITNSLHSPNHLKTGKKHVI